MHKLSFSGVMVTTKVKTVSVIHVTVKVVLGMELVGSLVTHSSVLVSKATVVLCVKLVIQIPALETTHVDPILSIVPITMV